MVGCENGKSGGKKRKLNFFFGKDLYAWEDNVTSPRQKKKEKLHVTDQKIHIIQPDRMFV